jgi:hypothetical protein
MLQVFYEEIFAKHLDLCLTLGKSPGLLLTVLGIQSPLMRLTSLCGPALLDKCDHMACIGLWRPLLLKKCGLWTASRTVTC